MVLHNAFLYVDSMMLRKRWINEEGIVFLSLCHLVLQFHFADNVAELHCQYAHELCYAV